MSLLIHSLPSGCYRRRTFLSGWSTTLHPTSKTSFAPPSMPCGMLETRFIDCEPRFAEPGRVNLNIDAEAADEMTSIWG